MKRFQTSALALALLAATVLGASFPPSGAQRSSHTAYNVRSEAAPPADLTDDGSLYNDPATNRLRLRNDGAWADVGNTGDVVGPASSTDNAVARFDLTTGKLLQNSAATLDDTGNLTANAHLVSSWGSVSAPAFGRSNGGWYFANGDANEMSMALGGSRSLSYDNTGNLALLAGGSVINAARIKFGGSGNSNFGANGGSAFAFYHGTNATRVEVYQHYTSATDYNRLAVIPALANMTIAAESGSAGTSSADIDITLTPKGIGNLLVGNAMELSEMTMPAAPAANKARLFARDNGAGKTQLVVRFPSGAEQVIATEP